MPNMMIQHGGEINSAINVHVCDEKNDLQNIPANEITLGTVAIVLEDTGGALGLYMAKSDKTWKKVG